MAFTAIMENIIKQLPCKSVCEFGNQRNRASPAIGTVKELYFHYGYTRYLALDVNEKKDAIIADLNQPVDLGETFDLVTNNGTSEHIFNQAMVFENAHNLSHGYMVHCLPFTPWVNHGFFNYNPIFFRDLASANDYDARIFIASAAGSWFQLKAKDLFAEKHPIKLEKKLEKLKYTGHSSLVVAILRKTNGDAFRPPFQGKYLKDIEGDLESTYSSSLPDSAEAG